VLRQLGKIQNEKRLLQRQLLKLTRFMLQGSLVHLSPRCGKPHCHCHHHKKAGHPATYLSVPTPEKTQMHYLPKDLLPQLPQRLKAFKDYWEIGKKISQINLALLKLSHSRRKKNHVRSR